MPRIKSELLKQAGALKRKADEKKVVSDADESPKPRVKRRKRAKSKARALRKEIHRLQCAEKYMIPKAALDRVIRSITSEMFPGKSFRWTGEAIENIQMGGEAYIHSLFKEAYQMTQRVGKRQTVRPEEFRMVALQHEDARHRFSSTKD